MRNFVWLTHQMIWSTYIGNPVKEILLKMNLPDHRIKQRWRWRHLVSGDCQFTTNAPTLNFFPSKDIMTIEMTYNTASATLRSSFMIKKSVSMRVSKIEESKDFELATDRRSMK
ncbi:hypothetical protein Tco_1345893 [Tanacetum coccineum]